MNPDPKTNFTKLEAWLLGFVAHERLGFRLAVVAAVLATPCLFVGFHLDDHIGRFIHSDLPGADRLFHLYSGGYGLANGIPADTRWQMEQGYAPWWTDPALHIELFRPLSLATHFLDAFAFEELAPAQHAHSIAWLVLLVLAVTRLYRGVLGPVAGGMAALLFAVDHTHGFVVGFISNRHALVCATFGILCLDAHHRATLREGPTAAPRAGAAVLYLASLLAGEFAISVAGYLFAHVVFVERGSKLRRALSFAPYLVLTLAWRLVYTKLGYGTHGSGQYVDPLTDPLEFVLTFARRAPVLCLGQFFLPPAEFYVVFGPVAARVVQAAGALFVALFVAALSPLLRGNPLTRFWAAGFVVSLVPATAAYPSGRLLLFSSFGAIALVAQLWHHFVVDLAGKPRTPLLRLSEAVGGAVLFVHVAFAPVASPFAVCGVLVSAPLTRAADALGPEIAGKDVLLVSAPDFFAARLATLRKPLEGSPSPRRWRALSAGPEPVTVERAAASTLVLEWRGGLLGAEYMQLFRSRRRPMHAGESVKLEGVTVTVRQVTSDGRPLSAEFAFDEPLDSPRFVAYAWQGGTYAPFALPPVGGSVTLPVARVELPWF